LLFFDLGIFFRKPSKALRPSTPDSYSMRQHLLDRLWLGHVGFDISFDADNLSELDDAGTMARGR
jgi:hypothetical protein